MILDWLENGMNVQNWKKAWIRQYGKPEQGKELIMQLKFDGISKSEKKREKIKSWKLMKITKLRKLSKFIKIFINIIIKQKYRKNS